MGSSTIDKGSSPVYIAYSDSLPRTPQGFPTPTRSDFLMLNQKRPKIKITVVAPKSKIK